MRCLTSFLAAAGCAAALATRTAAQQTSSTAVVAAGVTGGALRFADGRAEQGMAALVAFQPASWATLSLNPSVVHATDSTGAPGRGATGLTDLPVELALSHQFGAVWSPAIGASFDVTLPTGNSAVGLGAGTTSFGAALGVGVSPLDRLSLSADVGGNLGGAASNSLLSGAQASWADADASVDLSHATVDVGYATDLGARDTSTARSRSLTGGVAVPLRGAWALTMDGSRGITRAAPAWAVAVGVGTTFGELQKASGFGRLAHAFGRSVNRGRGAGKIGGKP